MRWRILFAWHRHCSRVLSYKIIGWHRGGAIPAFVFLSLGGVHQRLGQTTLLPYNYRTRHRILYEMKKVSALFAKSRLSGDSPQHGISSTRASHIMTNNIHGNSNSNVGNVSNSYNNIVNVGVNEESLLIQAWLSPLEPHRRHRDVSNRRFDGVGDWVLQKSEFDSWCASQDGSGDPTLLCYGGQGVGKTYIR